MKSDTQLRGASAALQGRELDALIAEKVMGLNGVFRCAAPFEELTVGDWYFDNGGIDYGDVPRYSTSIEAAFQVVEKMRERGWTPSICSLHPKPAWNSWVVAFHDHTKKQNRASARADTAPLAIVLAALAALEQGQAPEESGDMGRG